jgi:hypothetical protein
MITKKINNMNIWHNKLLMYVHDMIHTSNGLTTTINATGFGSRFWLFHANWDRLFWQWQKLTRQTWMILRKMLKRVYDRTDWIDGLD